MKAIQKFVADDGTEFLTEHDARKHEELCQEVWSLMQRLRPVPESCDFSNGAGFVQQVPADVLSVQAGLARIAKRYFKRDDVYDRHFDYTINALKPTGHTFVGRLIDDGCPRPVSRAWHRIMCISEDFREWGQPYYASHPHEAKQVDLSPSGAEKHGS